MGQRIWTAEEIEQLSPAEQDALFEASVVTSLDDVPEEFLTKVRQRFQGWRYRTGAARHRPRSGLVNLVTLTVALK